MDRPELDRAVRALAQGKIVAAATETFFGLLAVADDPRALRLLFRVKPRGAGKGVPLILPDRAAWSAWVVGIPYSANVLADAFWPGPLTIALPAAIDVDERLLLGGSIAVRVPSACPAGRLSSELGRVLTATSANRPGHPPVVDADGVRAEFSVSVDRGDVVVVDSTAPGNLPSTVVSVVGSQVHIVREAAVTRADVEGDSELPIAVT